MAGMAGLALVLIFAAGTFFYNVFRPRHIPEARRKFTIYSGEAVRQTSARLSQANLIRSDFWFRTYVWLTGREKYFLAGNFSLPEKSNTASLVSLLTFQAAREVRLVKILEGWTIRDIEAYLQSATLWRPGEFSRLIADNDFSSEFALVKTRPINNSLEGYLFPDTYQIFPEAGPAGLARKMLANFEKKVSADLVEEIERRGKDFYAVLTIASIVEAEVPHAPDRPIVSQIFWDRLLSGIPLQSDATLNYVLEKKTSRLSGEQLVIDSPYNTYKYKGLPPTPIGNPGLDSIKAAIYPAGTDYLYFLSTREGETIFSRTLEEHNIAKAKHLN